MIIANGHIKVLVKAGGGKDAKGNPIKVSYTPGTPIECNIKTNTHNNKGVYVDGKFTQSKYILLIDMDPSFTADRISINYHGKDLGDFQVQDIEYLDAVDSIKITV